jgi:hypothetical protein
MDLRGFEDENEYWETGPSASPKKKVVIPALCLSLIAALLVFRGVFATNIGINSATNVEFGQGVTIATSCDSQVTLTPYASFVNSGSGMGTFKFSSFKLSNVNMAACNGVTFKLSAYDSATAAPLALTSTLSTASVIDSNTGFMTGPNQSGFDLTDTTTAGAFTAQFENPAALASNVYKLTLETFASGGSISSASVFNPVFVDVTSWSICLTQGWNPCGIWHIYNSSGVQVNSVIGPGLLADEQSVCGSGGCGGGAGGSYVLYQSVVGSVVTQSSAFLQGSGPSAPTSDLNTMSGQVLGTPAYYVSCSRIGPSYAQCTPSPATETVPTCPQGTHSTNGVTLNIGLEEDFYFAWCVSN